MASQTAVWARDIEANRAVYEESLRRYRDLYGSPSTVRPWSDVAEQNRCLQECYRRIALIMDLSPRMGRDLLRDLERELGYFTTIA